MNQQELYHQGLEKMRQQDYPGAIEIFTQAIAINPLWADNYCQRGLAYFDLGKIHDAVSDYSQALQLNPESKQAYSSRALARLALKNLPGALEDINHAVQLNDQDAAAYQLRGIVYRKMGNIDAAIMNFKQAAKLYLDQEDKAGGRRCLELIKPLQPQQKTVAASASSQTIPMISEADFYQKLIEKAEKGDCAAALQEIDWVLQADSQDSNAYCCRGIIRCKSEDYHNAMADLNLALKFNPDNILAYRNRGKVRSQLGDYLGAIADFNHALKSQPDDRMLYIARGNTYRFAGNYPDAIQDYTKALELDAKDGNAYYYRGMAYACIEEIEQAITDYQQAVSQFCEQENWQKYHQVLDSLQRLQKGSSQANTQAVSGALRQRLLRLVGGHWEIAQRLIDQARQNYPGMVEEWYIEKVIYDIEQER